MKRGGSSSLHEYRTYYARRGRGLNFRHCLQLKARFICAGIYYRNLYARRALPQSVCGVTGAELNPTYAWVRRARGEGAGEICAPHQLRKNLQKSLRGRRFRVERRKAEVGGGEIFGHSGGALWRRISIANRDKIVFHRRTNGRE